MFVATDADDTDYTSFSVKRKAVMHLNKFYTNIISNIS